MKISILITLAVGAVAYPAEAPPRDESEGHVIVSNGIAPEMQPLKPRFTSYHQGVKRTKVRYGKYTLPPIDSSSLMTAITGEKGIMTTVAIGMKKPCDTCSLITARAGLEYANGTEATAETGSWLHHIVFLMTGSGRRDTTCPIWPGERFFSSGNERTPTAFGDVVQGKIKAAFPISPRDGLQSQLELMNMDNRQKEVWITVDWEYIPGELPVGFKRARGIWLDVTNCGISSVSPPRGKRQFTLSMRRWTSDFNGDLMGVGGHLHDGGTHLEVFQNDKVICDSKATYSKEGGGTMGMNMKAKRDGPHAHGGEHIESMSTCINMGRIKRGDTVHIVAHYDFDAHDPMPGSTASTAAPVMGIAIMYAGADV